MFLENVRDRSAGYLMAEILKSALDPGVSPSRIITRHAENELGDLLHHAWSSRLSPRAVVPLPRNQPPVPGQDRVRSDDRRHVAQELSTERLAFHREPSSLVIGEAETLATELAFEDAVLLDEVINDILLVTVDPAGDGDQKELPRMKRVHVGR